MSRIDRFFTHANQLPALPEVALRLLDCFRREDVSLVELSELIARDSALAARVLRLANSARYGNRRRVAHLPDAAALIGLNGLRGLALAAALVDVFPRPRGFDRQRFWRQNLATAGNARSLALVLDHDAALAEVAGLLLRSGQVLMLMTEPGQVALVESLSGRPDSVFALEREHFGCTHAEVSAELAARWHLPLELVDALYTAGNPLAAEPFSALGGLLRVASVLADAGEDGLDRAQAATLAQPALLARLGLGADVLQARLTAHELLVAPADEIPA